MRMKSMSMNIRSGFSSFFDDNLEYCLFIIFVLFVSLTVWCCFDAKNKKYSIIANEFSFFDSFVGSPSDRIFSTFGTDFEKIEEGSYTYIKYDLKSRNIARRYTCFISSLDSPICVSMQRYPVVIFQINKGNYITAWSTIIK